MASFSFLDLAKPSLLFLILICSFENETGLYRVLAVYSYHNQRGVLFPPSKAQTPESQLPALRRTPHPLLVTIITKSDDVVLYSHYTIVTGCGLKSAFRRLQAQILLVFRLTLGLRPFQISTPNPNPPTFIPKNQGSYHCTNPISISFPFSFPFGSL